MIYIFYTLLILFLVNLLLQFINESRLQEKYPPPGKMVNAGGFHLHFNCMGEGNSTVVFESGAGMFSLEWLQIQKMAAASMQNVKFCSYDRAGLGWSDAANKDFSIVHEVDDLHNALSKLGIENNIYLVAHSYGGFIATIYAQKYPDAVKGVVLVDSNSLHFFEKNPKFIQSSKVFSQIMKYLAPTGIIQLLSGYILSSQIPPGEEDKTRFTTLSTSMKSLRALGNSGIQFAATIATVQDYSMPKNIAVTIVSRGIKEKGFPETAERDWREGHKILHKALPLSKLIIAEKSDHMIPYKEPELIIKSIREMIRDKN